MNVKGAAFVDFTEGAGQEGGAAGARPATAAAGSAASRVAAKPSTRPATAASRVAPRQPAKKTNGGGDESSSVALNENLAGVDDPIALSMQERIKAGGLSSQITEAVAKKDKIKIFRAPKHVLKAGGNALITFVEGDGAGDSNNLRVPAKQAS